MLYAFSPRHLLPGCFFGTVRVITDAARSTDTAARCVKELWSQGVRMFTGEFWHGEPDYAQIMLDSSAFLRAKIEEAAALADAE